MPALVAFHASYPDLTLDLRAALDLEEPATKDCDLVLLHGWFEAGSGLCRELPVMPQVTVATPDSDSVGTAGRAAMRPDVLQPSITSRPDLRCRALAPTGSTAAWMRASSRSGGNCGAPL